MRAKLPGYVLRMWALQKAMESVRCDDLKNAREIARTSWARVEPSITLVTITRLSDGKIIQQTKRPGTGRRRTNGGS